MGIAKRNLGVVKWLSSTPVVGVCTFCSQKFQAPMPALSKTKDAQAKPAAAVDFQQCRREPQALPPASGNGTEVRYAALVRHDCQIQSNMELVSAGYGAAW
jgi:hypothetical protein